MVVNIQGEHSELYIQSTPEQHESMTIFNVAVCSESTMDLRKKSRFLD